MSMPCTQSVLCCLGVSAEVPPFKIFTVNQTFFKIGSVFFFCLCNYFGPHLPYTFLPPILGWVRPPHLQTRSQFYSAVCHDVCILAGVFLSTPIICKYRRAHIGPAPEHSEVIWLTSWKKTHTSSSPLSSVSWLDSLIQGTDGYYERLIKRRPDPSSGKLVDCLMKCL